jgi:GeoRSP system SPASM domain protein
MSLDLLDTPVRLTWDLHGPGTPLAADEMLTVAGRIAAGGVFFVTLEEHPLAHPAVALLLAELAAGGCRLQLACAGDDAELTVLEALPAPRPGVQLDVAAFLTAVGLDATRLQATLARLRRIDLEPILRLTPLASNLSRIPQLMQFCAAHDVGCFKLPNARIGDTFPTNPPGELPRWPDLQLFRALWTRQPPRLPEALQLEIHDRFLWEIMTPDREQARSEYGGCQAANSLGHVDAAGNVYACAAWPEPLGSLRRQPLEEIWQSAARHKVRERVATTPSGCFGCRDYALCLGGCRGLGTNLNPDGGGRDLMCRAPR